MRKVIRARTLEALLRQLLQLSNNESWGIAGPTIVIQPEDICFKATVVMEPIKNVRH